MRKIDKLRNFFLNNIRGIVEFEGEIKNISFPEFELYAFDYLSFGEKNLLSYIEKKTETEKTNELISCVSNLKRALDVQIECFLHCYGIRQKIQKRNLGLDYKLKFIQDIGVFSSRSIRRFCIIRNKIEHDFQRPKVLDIESLYDLVSACVSLLQMYSYACSRLTTAYQVYDGKEECGTLGIRYCYSGPKVVYTFKYGEFHSEVHENDFEISAELKEKEEFVYFFKCMLLLTTIECHSSWESVEEKLKTESGDGINSVTSLHNSTP